MMCGGFPEFLAALSDFRSDTIDPELRYGAVLCRSDTIKRVAKYLHVLHTIFTAVPVRFIVPLVNDSFLTASFVSSYISNRPSLLYYAHPGLRSPISTL
jgi:hypothetical protein